MSQLPLVTIAIPTYNRATTYLRPCLAGALQQKYPNLEIIVADNGSSDNTPELIRGIGDRRIRYIRHPHNILPNDNFNFCLQQARGEYFLLLLDDEQIDPDFVEACIDAAQGRADVGLIRTGLRAINANGTVVDEIGNYVTGPRLSDLALAWFENRTALYLCNTLFNRSELLRGGGFRSRHNLFQDVAAQVRIAGHMSRVDISDVKATTRRHGQQLTYRARVKEWCEDSLELLDLIISEVTENQDLIRSIGRRFFANICYGRGNAIRSPIGRVQAYWTVYSAFEHCQGPSPRMILSGTSAYRLLRRVKRWLLQRPIWME